MTKPTRTLLLVSSALVVLLLLGGGLMVKVGAAEDSYRQAVLFAEVLSLVLENYVDPVEAEGLLRGAYEGMLAGLDPNGAYLTPEEVEDWKSGRTADQVGPGIAVLKVGRILQVVAVDSGGSADEAGVLVGDQIRSVNGTLTRDLSLEQARRLIRGKPGSKVAIDLLRPSEGFRRLGFELTRAGGRSRAYTLEVDRGVAVLRIEDFGRLEIDSLSSELDEVGSRGIETLLLDLRNVAEGTPRLAQGAAGLFSTGTLLRLRDRSGRVLVSLESDRQRPAWTGAISLLVNGATAGASEALASVLHFEKQVRVFGEETYGLGAEAKLFELESGAGLLVSAALWETPSRMTWNDSGLQPDEVVSADGKNFAEAQATQLQRVLDLLEREAAPEPARKAA